MTTKVRFLIAAEDRAAATPGLNRLASLLAWRFTIAARKPATSGALPMG